MALVAANGAVCAGWAVTPEARMACCTEGDECPMHDGASPGSNSVHTMTQAQADACCATSERNRSSQSSPTSAPAISSAVLGLGVDLPASLPPLVLSGGWRTDAPVRIAPVPRYILLSVFLV